ncbi:MAG: hypothetical protein L0221_05385 [Chloroflexi bacterium]|nr:hypothetical protein [Chloroflexota bacterium]
MLFIHDPIGINYEENTDEYDPEVATILPRLRTAQTPADVVSIVHEEFVRWFNAEIAGPPERYAKIGDEIWKLWLESPISKPRLE